MLCAINYHRRQTRQLRYLNTVTLARGARFNRMQKNNAARAFFHAHAQIAHTRQLLRQHRQLVIMRRKQCARSRLRM